MGNHTSQDRRDRSKGSELGQYTGSIKADGQPFTLHPRSSHSTNTTTSSSKHSQGSEDDHPPLMLKDAKDKDGDDSTPTRPRPRPAFTNKKMLPVVIKWSGGGSNVAIAGSFNQWQKIPMVKSEKDFVAIVDLPEGSHQYKFLVDGEWKISKQDNNNTPNNNTNNTTTANNNNNNKTQSSTENNNNVITISETDFEEFETALLPDPNDKGGKEGSQGSGSGKEKESGSEEDMFGQEIPEYQQSEKIRGPPVLPPHLLQVILNKDTPISCEPTLLPNPNHVMLNHMYALSIRDGMMVLSTSNRYRKKCVTTLIYRPI